MIDILKRPLAAIVASAVLLSAILGWMVVDRVRLLASGREIVLPIRPVDPRDLFKGDYVRLGFDISVLDKEIAPGEIAPPGYHSPPRAMRTVYVTLEQQADQSWKPVAAAFRAPASPRADQVVIKGRMRAWSPRQVNYGIERYFVPEGTGGGLEKLARTSKLAAIVAVDAKGNAAIKGLVVDGRRVYEEPLL
mgnify:CR=1 FL=1